MIRRPFFPSAYSGHSEGYGEPITLTLAIIGAAGALGAGAFKYAGARKIAKAEGVSASREEALAKEAMRSQERIVQLNTLMSIKEQQAAEASQKYLIKGVLTVAGLLGLAYVGLKALQPDAEGTVDAEGGL